LVDLRFVRLDFDAPGAAFGLVRSSFVSYVSEGPMSDGQGRSQQNAAPTASGSERERNLRGLPRSADQASGAGQASALVLRNVPRRPHKSLESEQQSSGAAVQRIATAMTIGKRYEL